MDYEFNTDKGIFTLYNPETGKDWSNHLFNDEHYIMSVTHTGVPFSRYVNKDAVQVTLNCPLSSFVYVRDVQTKDYWNIAGYPSLRKISRYACEHGQQYTRISSRRKGIAASLTFAVAPSDVREVWRVTVQNTGKRERVLDLFAVTAFDLNGYSQPVYYSAVTTSATDFDERLNGVYCDNNNPYRPHELSNGYILSSEKVAAYDGNYEKFIGTMGTQTKPYVLEHGLNCTCSAATVRSRGGILQNRVTLAAGEQKTVYYVLGLAKSRESLIESRQEILRSCEEIIAAAENGEQKFGRLRTVCPDKRFERVFNYWAEHQVSYCMLGKKAVRDNAQLALAMLDCNVPLAKKTVDECLVHQYSDGHAVLTWYPYVEQNVYSDPSAWLVYAVCAYIKESGDFGYLNAEFDYMDGGKGSVRDHLQRAERWFSRADNYGEHGLPLIHHADWNDALNIPDENAESVMMAMLVCKAYDDLSELFARIGDSAAASECAQKKERLAKTVNEVSYNGEYYVRAFSRFGTVGDRTSENGGNIYVNPQSWSILSGVCPPQRIQSVTAAMDGMETDEGIPLCAPPYKKYDERVGRMSGMLPGVYENGGIYNHAGCFKVMADCALGRGDRAVAALRKILPDGERNPSAVTTTEPYVFTNCYLKHPSVDMQVGFSWQTGTSAWGLRCYYEGILGIQSDYDGLRIFPSLPKDWQSVQAWRDWRGNRLHITFDNACRNDFSLIVDGTPVQGNTVPPFADNSPHEILVKV